MRKVLLLTTLVGLLPVGLFAQQADNNQQKALVFTHVTVIDATGAPVKPEMTVVVRGDRIEALGKTGKLAIPQNAQVVDATGKFLIPGLWDMHVHAWLDKRYHALFTANGVTGIRVMQGESKHHRWRKEISAGELIGPRMVIASEILEGPNYQNGLTIISNEEEGRLFVRKSRAEGADFIKIYHHLPRDTYFAIVDEAKKQGLPFVGHVPYSVSVAEASDAGQQSFEHYYGILLGCSSLEGRFKKLLMHEQLFNDDLLRESYTAQKAAELFDRFVKNRTWVCPTNAIYYGFWFPDEQDLANEPGLEYLPLDIAKKWHSRLDARTVMPTEERDRLQISRQRKFDVLNAMRRAGVGLLAGTDTPLKFCLPGFALHEELELLVKAGLSPMEALRTATYNPAKFFGKLDSMGTVEQGKMADLVLLDANPLEDISNTRRIAAVVSGGRILDKTALDEMFAQLKASRLHTAAAEGQIEYLKSLIAEGADVNARDQHGFTVLQTALCALKLPVIDLLLKNGADSKDLYLAAYTGNFKSIKKLLEKNTPLDSLDGFTLLHAAAAGGHVDIIELLIARGYPVTSTATAKDNATPLHYAVARNYKEAVQVLIANGAQIESGDMTPLAWAAQRGHKDLAELLIAKGADVNARDRWASTSLHYACMRNRKEVAEFLISEGADVDTTDYEGRTPLHLATEGGHRDVGELLIAREADVDAKDRLGKTSLHLAAKGGHKDLGELLIARKADVDAKDNSGATPLHFAVIWGHKDIGELLIARKADINAMDNRGRTPLHFAVLTGQEDMAELLLAKGADVNARDQMGWTALYDTSWNSDEDMAELLLAKGADINAKDHDAWTALHNASWNNRKDIAEFLISNGADINTKDNNGQTPLHFAADHRYKAIVDMLLSQGADFRIKDKRGKTALDLAKDKGHIEIAELLRKHEAHE